MKTTLRVLLSVTASAVFTVGVVGATPAHADPEPGVKAQAVTEEAQQNVLRYWSKQRMQTAVPMERLLKLRNRSVAEVKDSLNQVAPLSIPNNGSPWTAGGQIVSTAGRVFFTYQGRTASCSGNAVVSANRSTVITAGHCVKLGGAWHTNWMFVPAYNNGNAPYGQWTARATLATPQWTASENINFDIGSAVVNQLNGQNLTDVVGSQGIAFNQPRQQNMYSFGYPAAAPYDGTRLIYCSGRAINDFFLSTGIGLNCTMTGGSSGGPWFLNFSEATGTGTLNSVNSFKYNFPFLSNYMFGPYFGPDAQNLYNTAQAS